MHKKYLVLPGEIKSISDGQRHYVTAGELMRLYRVPRSECVVLDEREQPRMERHYRHLIALFPRYHYEDYEAFLRPPSDEEATG